MPPSENSAIGTRQSAIAATPLPKSTAIVGGKTVDVFDLRHRITVLSPCYDYQLTEYYHNSLEACKQARAHYRLPDGSIQLLPIIAGRISLPNDSHVDRARNVVCNIWVEQNPHQTDFALWWDVDVEKHPEHILRFFIHAMQGHRFVCGHYAMKCLRPTFVANVKPGARPDPKTGLIELLHGGTGSMLWHIEVPRLLQAHPAVKPYKTAPNTPWPGVRFWSYFHSGVEGSKPPADTPIAQLADWNSEDWQACRDWQDLGGVVLGDTEIKLRHFGRMLYPPQVDELVDAVVSLLDQHHPAIDIPRLREAVAKYHPAELKAAA